MPSSSARSRAVSSPDAVRAAVALTSCSWASLPGSAATGDLPEPVAGGRADRGAVLGGGVGVHGRQQLGDQGAQQRRVGLTGQGLEHDVDEVAGAHLGVAGHVPQRGQHQGARQRAREAARVRQGRGQRALVEPDLGVGEVVVVDEQQVGLLAADQLGHRGARALDVELEVVGAVQRPVAHGVHADDEGVRAQRLEARGAGLLDGGRRDAAAVVDLDDRAQRADPGGLEPLARPGAQVAAGGGLELAEQVVEGGVAPGVLGEVGADAVAERLAPDVGHQLLEHRGALGVGDAVEVDLDVLAGRGSRRRSGGSC